MGVIGHWLIGRIQAAVGAYTRNWIQLRVKIRLVRIERCRYRHLELRDVRS